MSRKKYSGRPVNGVLLLDKPTGITSNAALQQVKRIFGARKAGHTGSLDPLASGMLPICFGEATKFSQYLLNADKKYLVTAKLGEVTTTSDSEGEVINTREVPVLSLTQIEEVLTKFRGETSQIPSMFSAIKHEGQPLYKLAREGIEVERKPRNITIYSLELTDKAQHTISLKVHCSKGTYIRNLVEDIGEQLGCGGHVIELARTEVGPYKQDAMISMDVLESLYEERDWSTLNNLLLSEDSMVEHYPRVELTDTATFYLFRGQSVQIPYSPTEGMVRLMTQTGDFVGIGEVLDDGKIAPRRLVKQPQPQS